MKDRKALAAGLTMLILGVVLGMYWSNRNADPQKEVHAAGGKVISPTGTAPDRYVYYPGTEKLAKNEIRVVCCGSGMPAARHG